MYVYPPQTVVTKLAEKSRIESYKKRSHALDRLKTRLDGSISLSLSPSLSLSLSDVIKEDTIVLRNKRGVQQLKMGCSIL